MAKKKIDELIEISRFYGSDRDYVIAGGGNTSWKDQDKLWIKASGTSLADIGHDGLVVMDRKKLQDMSVRKYSNDPDVRESQIKNDLYASCAEPDTSLRPSVETNLHDIIGYSFVVHLHPAVVNALLCSRDSREMSVRLFPDALYVEYTDPGYTLFCRVLEDIRNYRKLKGKDPHVILLENHGVFVSADSTAEITEIYSGIFSKLGEHLKVQPDLSEIPVSPDITRFIPAFRMMLSSDGLKTLVLRHNKLIAGFYASKDSFSKISAPFTPDIIVYCKSRYLYLENSETPEELIDSFRKELSLFREQQGYFPRIILIKGYGLIGVGDNWNSAFTSLDVYEDLMKISFYSGSFGGPGFMTEEQISFIDNWEVENYRRNLAKGAVSKSVVSGKVAIVTGGAMGFGAGIASSLIVNGANVVIADINEKESRRLVNELNSMGGRNRAGFVRTDAGSPESVKSLIIQTVGMFGGLDLMVSNAGILYAGALDEMSEEIFEKVTRVNYSGYFHCAKYASAVMKLQYEHNSNHFTDIIQINSKSGLKGSNRNFAYAGGKFGGIGLTQSFALELIDHNIKVNAICPGNFFEGPLWSDPENGLFIQYLRAGKVPGAKTIGDVKKHYEKQVPAGRGCRVEDIMKALFYIVDQQYETGQAVPVTGGQNMLH